MLRSEYKHASEATSISSNMCIMLQIHRNILSSQCYIRCVGASNSFNMIHVKCFSSKLELFLRINEEIVKKVKMIFPNEFFIPSSLSSDSESSLISGSSFVCPATLTPAKQSIVECSFRLGISGADKLDKSNSELKVDVKDFFKERFKNPTHWHLFCASCGVGLPIEPVYIRTVHEYCKSELSEEWFCHGSGSQPGLHLSSEVLYLDDTSFYLYPTSGINQKVTTVVDKKCCTYCKKEGCICALITNCSNNSYPDSSGHNWLSESPDYCCKSENINQTISETLNSVNFLTSSVTTKDIDSFCVEQTNSSTEGFAYHACADFIHTVVECQSCGDILTTKKSSFPFVRFYLDKLMFKNFSFNDDHLEYAHNITVLSFWSLVTRGQTSLMPSKLFLESKVRDEELCLLLWVPSAPVDQFLLQDSLEAVSSEINLQTEPVYKVLYFLGTSLSENVCSWRHDFGVDYYHVSDKMVKTLVGILNASSRHLPKTSASGGFSCGFLRAPSQLLH